MDAKSDLRGESGTWQIAENCITVNALRQGLDRSPNVVRVEGISG